MARRQDSGSNSSHENQRPNAQNEDRLPEFTEDTRGHSEDEDEFEEGDDETEMEDEEEDEGTI
jgi:hypothetical protein